MRHLLGSLVAGLALTLAAFGLAGSEAAHAQAVVQPVLTCPSGYSLTYETNGTPICVIQVAATTYVAPVSYVTAGYYSPFASYGYPMTSYGLPFASYANTCCSPFSFPFLSGFASSRFIPRIGGRGFRESGETEPVCPAGQRESERTEACH